MRTPLSERSLRRVAESMIADFGEGAEAEVEARIVQARDRDLPTVARSWHLVRRLIEELRTRPDGGAGPATNGAGDSLPGDGL